MANNSSLRLVLAFPIADPDAAYPALKRRGSRGGSIGSMPGRSKRVDAKAMNGPYAQHRSAPCVQWPTVIPPTSALVRQATRPPPEVVRRHALARNCSKDWRVSAQGVRGTLPKHRPIVRTELAQMPKTPSSCDILDRFAFTPCCL